jgi:muramoyltetrapeptide carboxypeptidase
MVAVEFAGQFSGKTEELFWRAMTSTKRLPPLPIRPAYRSMKNLTTTTGRVIGGNLSILASLAGTPYFPSSRELVYILEEIDERPYRIDRMLQQLRLTGAFDRGNGILLGNFTNCLPEQGKPSLSLDDVFSGAFSTPPVPVMGNLKYGHLKNSWTIPLGVTVRIHPRRGLLEFLEPAVAG